MEKFAVIMAGGSGTRLWPLSRESRPKQFIHIGRDKNMLFQTLERLNGVVSADKCYVVTNTAQKSMAVDALQSFIPPSNIIVEPLGKNTAACITYAVLVLKDKFKEGMVYCIPSDSYIKDDESYKSALETACGEAENKNCIVVIGITPSYPATGYGYVKVGASQPESEDNVFPVQQFLEKPCMEKAGEFVASGQYLWNCGMVIGTLDCILDNVRKFLPELFYKLSEAINISDIAEKDAALKKAFQEIESISFDHGVLERSKDIRQAVKSPYKYKSVNTGENDMKRALITGITGQDGSYLTEFLLDKGYEVNGIIRRASNFNTKRIDHLLDNPARGGKSLFLHYGDLTDSSNLNRLIEKTCPDEIYNLAAQSHVQVSFEVPEHTAETNAIGTLRLLDAIRENNTGIKFYQASTSELFGGLPGTEPQNEHTPFYPRSPYAAAKLYAYWITVNYREAYNLFACNGILFNHESPRRGETFVTRKITKAVCNIVAGRQEKLSLGNLDAKRDWGFAGDYVEAMWLMLQQEKPDDYVIATGETTTVRQFVEIAFKEVGIDIEWKGSGLEEKGYDQSTGKILVDVNPRYFRPTEVEVLLGDPTKAEQQLGWQRKVDLKGLIRMMVASDFKNITGQELTAFLR